MGMWRGWMGAMGGLLLAIGVATEAQAQQPGGDPTRPAVPTGWAFNVAPYLWVPKIDMNVNYKLPGAAGELPTTFSVTPSDYLSKVHFAGMVAGEARYERFSILTDLMYIDINSSSFDTRIKSIDVRGRPRLPLTAAASVGSQTNMDSTIWTLAGGYTVLNGEWGNLDVIAGFRYAGISSRTDFNIGVVVTGPFAPRNSFGGAGSISGTADLWNGIAGARGKIRISQSNWYVPYYFDIGAGGSDLTWQISSGIGYQNGPIGISLLYRYLSFQQSRSHPIRNLDMGGPMAMLNFSF